MTGKITLLKGVAGAINSAGGRAEAGACHVGSLIATTNNFEHIRKQHGKWNILVNNTLANPYFVRVLDAATGVFNNTVDVNVHGYVVMHIEAVKLMSATSVGNIELHRQTH